MALDLTSLLLGLGAAALPLLVLAWQLQRKSVRLQAEAALLDERLSTAQMAQDGLNAQLDASRDEISDLSQANALKQADLAALRREVELLRQERDSATTPLRPGASSAPPRKASCASWTLDALPCLPSCANSRKAISSA